MFAWYNIGFNETQLGKSKWRECVHADLRDLFKELPLLYPAASRSREDLWLAGVHFHLQLKRQFPKFYLRDSLAQTCWIGRGVTS